MKRTEYWKLKALPLSLALATMAMFSTSASAAPSIAGIDLTKYANNLEHAAEIRIGTQSYAFLKLNYGGTTLQERVVDKSGVEYPPAEILKRYLGQFQKFGKTHPTLLSQLQKSPTASFKVMVWLAVPVMAEVPKPEKVEPGTEDRVSAELAVLHKRQLIAFNANKQSIIEKLKLKQFMFQDLAQSPFVAAKLNADQIKILSASTQVKMLLAYDERGRTDLATSLAISNADNVNASGNHGGGVRVAVFEGRPTNTANLNILDSYSVFAGIVPSTSNHAQNVSAIINNRTAVAGYAPSTSFYAADSTNIAAFNWAVDNQRVSAINQSFHRAAEIGDGMQADDIYKDYKVLHYPWPTIVQAAGNWCAAGSPCFEGGVDVTSEFVNHKGYNSISIGNHNDTATSMSGSSCFVNPSSPRRDRELPELSANGTTVTADGIGMSGTSQASPAVTGSAALLQSAASVLRFWPEGVRALLFAGATTNVATHAGTLAGGGAAANAPNTWWTDVRNRRDAFDGAGALNVEESARIAANRWAGFANQRGWDIGRMSPATFTRTNFFSREYQIHVPRTSDLRHIKVALAWNSTATRSGNAAAIYASLLELDLDIRIYDSKGNQVASSLSWDNSYEIADFRGVAGETYTIKVHRWPSSSNEAASTWFGIAWSLQ